MFLSYAYDNLLGKANMRINGVKKYCKYDNDELYAIAELNVAEMMAKMHTIDWKPAILWDDVIQMESDDNWYGGFYMPWFLSDKGP